MKKQRVVPFIRDIDDPNLVIRCLTDLLVIWFDGATKEAEWHLDEEQETSFNKMLRRQLQSVLTDLNDRENRLIEAHHRAHR